MVFQKASFTTKNSNGNRTKNNTTTTNTNTTNNKKSSPMTIYDDSGGFESSIIANNLRNGNGIPIRGYVPKSTSMVIRIMMVFPFYLSKCFILLQLIIFQSVEFFFVDGEGGVFQFAKSKPQ